MRPSRGWLFVAVSLALGAGGCRQVFGLEQPKIASDGAVIDVDAPVDVDPNAPCYGTWTATRTCFATPPAGTLSLTSTTYDTGGNFCTLVDRGYCIVAAGEIDVPSGVIAKVTGTRPLILLATTSITVTGKLDASSRLASGPTMPGSSGPGVGAACVDGAAPQNVGGGAGGTLGTTGGAGGAAYSGKKGGTPAAFVTSPTSLRAGCNGQGGTNDQGVAAGGGKGGGGIYLIAGDHVTIESSGEIAANGAGSPGTSRLNAGGGGGGSGGVIGLDAPSVTVAGLVWANGGGGAEGSGSTSAGNAGGDPTAYNAAAAGGAGAANNGGNGGSGAIATNSGGAGADGNGTSAGGGGGGGGGAGVIVIYAATSTTTAAMISPPPQVH